MNDLAQFLLARIAEDQALVTVESAPYVGDRWALFAWGHEIDLNFARVLAECEAKRRIVDFALQREARADESGYARGVANAFNHTLLLLALPHAGHPDYRPEWRP